MGVIVLYVGAVIGFGIIAVFIPGRIGARAMEVLRILAQARREGHRHD